MHPKRWLQYFLFLSIIGSLIVGALLVLMISILYPSLPSLEALTDYHPKLPLRIFDTDGELIGEFGQERRAFVPIEQTPQVMKDAILAIEDRRFYTHNGIDTTGIVRAIRNNLTGRGHEGASTITMQVAKNFFSGPDAPRNIWTKIKEAMLAIKIENAISKDKILELYLNQIYLGERAYGFAAASKTYFNKELRQINLAEAALLAGLPKAPSKYDPFIHPDYAVKRQHEVLRDMRRYGLISAHAFEQAMHTPLKFQSAKLVQPLGSEYVAEIVRATLYQRYGEKIYSSGLKVTTTIRKQHQIAANAAVIQGVINFELRHGFRGPEKVLSLPSPKISPAEGAELLREFVTYNQFVPALVTKVEPDLLTVVTKRGEVLALQDKALLLVKNHILPKKPGPTTVAPGAVIRVYHHAEGWMVVQLPEVESAFMALNPETGEVNALVGGFNFHRNKYNHVTQGRRQPGSSFKPFIYSAALDKGYTPASVFEDAPISFSSEQTGSGNAWEPHNYDEKYAGPMRLREALAQSKNTISIRLMSAIGARYAQDYLRRFGFNPKDHPPYLSTALGAGSTSVWQMAAAYATFANSGYRVHPYLIEKIVDSRGKVLQAVQPGKHVSETRVIDQRNAFIMTTMLQDVVRNGTARAALSLRRPDIAGKTGTTNDQYDAWFAGYHPKEVAIAWMGYDSPRNLGRGETGGRAALPIWIKYMQETLKGMPVYQYKVPEGIVQLKVDAYTGAQVGEDDPGIYEYFYEEFLPQSQPENLPGLFDPEDQHKEEDEHEPSFLERLMGEHTSGNEDKKLPVNPAAKLLAPN
ncbi:penicillin-binding protein 1A [Methylophilus aquaticus]|uniref:Penicillin-binding protein 1A n=1 Tax=Methylophilus aquaticus TaxID=1971610 RepID=A0ABT9JPB8_9PROT|nr:PBP1A family penicillin-binding protein [Methylophilus aquaticus]MDP8566418.1 PBP1A family penicillin-binding protein [Methylophilus aquaticus]